MTIEDYTPKPDWNALEKGFAIHQNHFTKYWFCNSVESNEDGDYQFCFRDMDYQAKQLCGLLNGLLIEYHTLKEKYEKLAGQNAKIWSLRRRVESYMRSLHATNFHSAS